MKLNRIEIENYRSIKSYKLIPEDRCTILVGKNESGKSNILKAISLLNEGRESSEDDVRDHLLHEDVPSRSHVYFVFDLAREDLEKISDECQADILCENYADPIVSIGLEKLNIKEYVNHKKSALYVANIKTGQKYGTRWNLGNEKAYKILSSWKKLKDLIPPSVYVTILKDGEQVQLRTFKIINIVDYPGFEQYVEDLTITGLEAIVRANVAVQVEASLPDCVVWEYSEKNLLPGRIDITQFKSKPETCIPLKNMFLLAGYLEIEESLSAAEDKKNGMTNLLRKVAEATTTHLRKVWPEKRDIKIYLRQNGTHIEAGVEDESNVFDFSRRSDGFKRFMTFLLLISATSKLKEISNAVIVIDEPDIGLHPSGAKYLLQELIEISKNNFVFFSTHSIFMIDKANIGRHLIIKKQKETTEITKADTSNLMDEEVIYNALGYSIFENLKEKNVVFEGWSDKELFRCALNKFVKPATSKAFFSSVGACHAFGVKDIPRIVSMLQLANREYLIVSDSDAMSRGAKKKFEENEKWSMYSELGANDIDLTAEDFVSFAWVKKCFDEEFVSPSGKVIVLREPTPSGSVLEQIRIALTSAAIEGEEQKVLVKAIKKRIFDGIKKSDVKDTYEAICKGILRKVGLEE